MTNDDLVALVTQLNARVSALEKRVDALSVPAGKGWSGPVTFHEDNFNRLTQNMRMPAVAMRDLVNGVGDRDVRTIAKEDRESGKTTPGSGK
jgi:hypothetical protein